MPIAYLTLFVVLFCWLAFIAIFAFRKRPPEAAERKRDSQAVVGIVIQMIAYFVAWAGRPRLQIPFLEALPGVELLIAVFAIALGVGSVVMVYRAVSTLGKQWAYAARIVEGHKLITGGPYRIVRHPIYAGMFGLLIASGLALGHWGRLLAAIALFLIGTLIRTNAEERLLRETFGKEYDDYARRVKALIPGIW